MAKRIEWIEFAILVICLLFIIVISLYHISYDGYLQILGKTWDVIWAVSNDGLMMTMSLIISLLSIGLVKKIFRWVFVPYFILKLVYDISCFSGVVFFEKAIWEDIWSYVLVISLTIFLFLCTIQIQRKDVG
jgi:hypothetical protein